MLARRRTSTQQCSSTPLCARLLSRYGFRGFYDRKAKPIVLRKTDLAGIHLEGGTGKLPGSQPASPGRVLRLACSQQAYVQA